MSRRRKVKRKKEKKVHTVISSVKMRMNKQARSKQK